MADPSEQAAAAVKQALKRLSSKNHDVDDWANLAELAQNAHSAPHMLPVCRKVAEAMAAMKTGEDEASVQLWAVLTIARLSQHSEEFAAELGEHGACQLVAKSMEAYQHHELAQLAGCGALAALAIAPRNLPSLKESAFQRVEFAMLVGNLKQWPNNENIQQYGVMALSNLLLSSDILYSIIVTHRAGGAIGLRTDIPVLAAMKKYPQNRGIQLCGCSAMASLVKIPGSQEISQKLCEDYMKADADKVVLAAMDAFPDVADLQENACLALHRLIADDEDEQGRIITTGGPLPPTFRAQVPHAVVAAMKRFPDMELLQFVGTRFLLSLLLREGGVGVTRVRGNMAGRSPAPALQDMLQGVAAAARIFPGNAAIANAAIAACDAYRNNNKLLLNSGAMEALEAIVEEAASIDEDTDDPEGVVLRARKAVQLTMGLLDDVAGFKDHALAVAKRVPPALAALALGPARGHEKGRFVSLGVGLICSLSCGRDEWARGAREALGEAGACEALVRVCLGVDRTVGNVNVHVCIGNLALSRQNAARLHKADAVGLTLSLMDKMLSSGEAVERPEGIAVIQMVHNLCRNHDFHRDFMGAGGKAQLEWYMKENAQLVTTLEGGAMVQHLQGDSGMAFQAIRGDLPEAVVIELSADRGGRTTRLKNIEGAPWDDE